MIGFGGKLPKKCKKPKAPFFTRRSCKNIKTNSKTDNRNRRSTKTRVAEYSRNPHAWR